MTAGQQFVKMLRPLGCALCLALFVGFMIMCFSAKAPVKDYVIPHDSEYFAAHLDELETELETNLFPKLDGIEDCYITGDKLTIIIDSDNYEQSSKAIIHYYGDKLFSIEKTEKE